MMDPFVDFALTFGVITVELALLLAVMGTIWIALPGWARVRLRSFGERLL